MQHIFFNGQIVTEDTAKVDVHDIGFLRGYGVFDSARTRRGKPALIDRHLNRLRRSAASLHIDIPYSDEELVRAMERLIELNVEREATIKIIVTGGLSSDGLTFDPATPSLYILVKEFMPLPAEYFHNGVKLITHEHQRQQPAIKSLDYLAMVQQQPRRQAAEAFEVLYHWNGELREAATSNVFVVRGNTVSTPSVDVLPGITRSVVLELARERYDVQERTVTMDELLSADEVFLTATNKDVLPVTTIDERQVGTGIVGPVTKELSAAFLASLA